MLSLNEACVSLHSNLSLLNKIDVKSCSGSGNLQKFKLEFEFVCEK